MVVYLPIRKEPPKKIIEPYPNFVIYREKDREIKLLKVNSLETLDSSRKGRRMIERMANHARKINERLSDILSFRRRYRHPDLSSIVALSLYLKTPFIMDRENESTAKDLYYQSRDIIVGSILQYINKRTPRIWFAYKSYYNGIENGREIFYIAGETGTVIEMLKNIKNGLEKISPEKIYVPINYELPIGGNVSLAFRNFLITNKGFRWDSYHEWINVPHPLILAFYRKPFYPFLPEKIEEVPPYFSDLFIINEALREFRKYHDISAKNSLIVMLDFEDLMKRWEKLYLEDIDWKRLQKDVLMRGPVYAFSKLINQ